MSMYRVGIMVSWVGCTSFTFLDVFQELWRRNPFILICTSFSLTVSIWKQIGINFICTASTTTASLATARGLCAVSITDHYTSAIL